MIIFKEKEKTINIGGKQNGKKRTTIMCLSRHMPFIPRHEGV